jgi:radical SAM protein with 4Fe4S-binding SPASM domain
LIKKKHVDFFKKYPPRDIEVTVYGVDKDTYEKITRVPGSFKAFTEGLDLLLENNIKVRFKAMAIRSNIDSLEKIKSFCRERTKDYFRFDPFLHLRFDGDLARNDEIRSERLTPSEIINIEYLDKERFNLLKKNCDKLINHDKHDHETKCTHVFYCGAGSKSFIVGYDGFFRLCSSLYHPDSIYDLRKGKLQDAWENFVPKVRDVRSNNEEFLKKCKICGLVNLCMWCPAHAHLETGSLDMPVDYFCEVAHARETMLNKK